jgi:hypothetical protein
MSLNGNSVASQESPPGLRFSLTPTPLPEGEGLCTRKPGHHGPAFAKLVKRFSTAELVISKLHSLRAMALSAKTNAALHARMHAHVPVVVGCEPPTPPAQENAMTLEELARSVRVMQVEQVMDAAIIGVLLRTHSDPVGLHQAWQDTGFASDDFEGEDLAAVRRRYDHWMEMIVAAKGG